MLLLAACAAPDVVDREEPAALPIPALESEPITPTWTAPDAVSAIEAALAGPFPSAFTIRTSLQGWFRHGDEACPGPGTYMAGPSFEGCTSAEGWYYLGVGGYTEEVKTDEEGDYVELFVMGDLQLVAPDGAWIDVGGHWISALREGPSFRGLVNGSWHEPQNDADWLAAGMSAWLEYAGIVDDAGQRVWLDGTLTLRGTTLGFTDLQLDDACTAGVVTVRDPGGGTWAVDFGECTPCGAVTFEGAAVETDACLALDGLADRVVTAGTP